MTVQMQPTAWEAMLLDWAHQPLATRSLALPQQQNDAALQAAYAYCDALTRENSRTFYLASSLLLPEKRRAVRALYAFCRVTDNLVDVPGETPNPQPPLPHGEGEQYSQQKLAFRGSDRMIPPLHEAETQQRQRGEVDSRRAALEDWRRLAMNDAPPHEALVAVAWADARARFNIPIGYAQQLIDGVAQDINKTRYTTFDELAAYSYGVASTVGLMAMHIVGYRNKDAIPYAIKLGVALQVTNILRDVGEDWRSGRVYLPSDELAAYGLTESDLAQGNTDARWQTFMAFQMARARRLYDEAMPGIAYLSTDGRFAIAAAAELYRAILCNIEHRRGDVFNGRAHISTWGKARRLPGIWWRSTMTRV